MGQWMSVLESGSPLVAQRVAYQSKLQFGGRDWSGGAFQRSLDMRVEVDPLDIANLGDFAPDPEDTVMVKKCAYIFCKARKNSFHEGLAEDVQKLSTLLCRKCMRTF